MHKRGQLSRHPDFYRDGRRPHTDTLILKGLIRIMHHTSSVLKSHLNGYSLFYQCHLFASCLFIIAAALLGALVILSRLAVEFHHP